MQEPAGPQVLMVDDDVSMQRMLRSRLEREGYTVVTAADGDEGLNLIRKHVFNLVITDMRMPKVKGDELARSITQFNPDIPVIIMTAYGEVNEAVRLMQDGVFYYLTKPFDVEELVQRVRKAVDRQRTAHEVNQVRTKIM
ncbi:MAG TPA: response regulator, partial [Vicinamibacteria bacterium]